MVEKLDEKLSQTGCHGQAANKAEVVDEYVDRQRRKTNIIVNNMPEHDGDTDDASQKDWMMIDRMFQRLHLKIEVKKVSRIGRRQEGKSRLLLVTLGSEELKWEALRVAKNLRQFDEYHGVYINPDLTKSEREQNRKLRDEVKGRRENGEDVVIYKGKIIKRTHRADTDAGGT